VIGSKALRALLGLAAVALAVTAVWLTFDNPVIDGTSRGDDYTCLAPWDTVLNDADNFPGGEPPPDGEEIAEDCREAGRERFDMAVASGSAAVVLAVLSIALARHRPRSAANSLAEPGQHVT
jgi:hypothetical protein